jgi:hypothetical protein
MTPLTHRLNLSTDTSERAHGLVVVACMAVVIGVLAVPAAQAAEPDVPSAPAGEPVQPLIEEARTKTRTLSERLARGVDSWFGDLPFEEGGKVSQGQLSLGVFHRRDQGTDVALRFTARFRLPNFEKSAYLFIGRDDPREAIKDTTNSSNQKQQLLASRPEDRSFLGGLGGALGDDVSFRVGVSARLQPFAQVRWDKPWVVSPGHVLNFRETLFWSRADRFGATSALTYELELQQPWALRWQGAATITQETRNFEWSSTLGLYRDFGLQKLLSLELLFSGTGTQGNGVGMSDRGVLAKWQQPLYRDWLLGEIAAGQFWLRPDANSPRGQAWAIGGSLKMRF